MGLDEVRLERLFSEAGSDKGKYARFYARWLPQIDPEVLIEIGVGDGGGMKVYQHAYPSCRVFGIDTSEKPDIPGTFLGDSSDRGFLRSVLAETGAPDVVIDDGGHRWREQIIAFTEIWPHLRPGGFYVIEDLETSYSRAYGFDHEMTATAYLARLLDVINGHDEPLVKDHEHYRDTIASIVFEPRICLIEKRAGALAAYRDVGEPPPLKIGGDWKAPALEIGG